jgi:hypothetical protein
MSKSTISTVTCTKEVKTQFENFLSKSMDSFVTKLMAEDDEDTTEEHLRELFQECFSTKAFKVTRNTKGKRAKSNGPKQPSNAYIQWSNAEGRKASQEALEKTALKKLKKMSSEEKEEEYNGETENDKILKMLVTSKDIVANAAKMWSKHKDDNDDTFQKYQTEYEKQREKYKKLKAEMATQETSTGDDEAGPAQEAGGNKAKSKTKADKSSGKSSSSTKSKSKAKTKSKTDKSSGKSTSSNKSTGKGKSKKKSSNTYDETGPAEEVDVKTYSLADFETFDGLAIHLGMTLVGGFDTKYGKQTFEDLDEAVEALEDDDEAVAVHLDNKGKYTVRSSVKMKEAKKNQAPTVTWVYEEDEDEEEE